MTFRGWSFPLERYFTALSEVGFQVDVVRESQPKSPSTRYRRFERVPMFLNIRATKS